MMSEEEDDEFESLSSHDGEVNMTYKQNGAVAQNDMSYISECLLPNSDRQPLIGGTL